MILICTDRDLGACSGMPFEEVSQAYLSPKAMRASLSTEDVYFWREVKNADGKAEGKIKAIKRRNDPLIVPAWLKDRKGVDR